MHNRGKNSRPGYAGALVLTLVGLFLAGGVWWGADPVQAGIVASEARIQEIRVEGAKLLTPEEIISYLDFKIGDLYSDEVILSSQKRLLASGLFRRVELSPEEYTYGKVRVTVKVEEAENGWSLEALRVMGDPSSSLQHMSIGVDYRRVGGGLAAKGSIGWEDGLFLEGRAALLRPGLPLLEGKGRLFSHTNEADRQVLHGEVLGRTSLPLTGSVEGSFALGVAGRSEQGTAGTGWFLMEPGFTWTEGETVPGGVTVTDRVDTVKVKMRLAVPLGASNDQTYTRFELEAGETAPYEGGWLSVSLRGGAGSDNTPEEEQFVLGGFRGLYALSERRGTKMALLTLSYRRNLLPNLPLVAFAEIGDVWVGESPGWSELPRDVGARLEYTLPRWGTELALTGAVTLGESPNQGRLQIEIRQPW